MISAEVHSVNSRFLDIKLKLPNMLLEFEHDIRKLIQAATSRGRLTLVVHLDEPSARANSLRVNFDIADRYLAIARELNERFGLADGLDTRGVMSLPDVLSYTENTSAVERIWGLSRNVIREALTAHTAMREREGAAMGADVTGRLKTIRGHLKSVEERAPQAVEANTARLREKIEKLIDTEKIDENRITFEVSLYADRVDITEECVRYKSHCNAFEHELENRKVSGKKLSFLLQEMNREANTIASKSNDASISQLVVLIKEEQEKIREQVENME